MATIIFCTVGFAIRNHTVLAINVATYTGITDIEQCVYIIKYGST